MIVVFTCEYFCCWLFSAIVNSILYQMMAGLVSQRRGRSTWGVGFVVRFDGGGENGAYEYCLMYSLGSLEIFASGFCRLNFKI